MIKIYTVRNLDDQKSYMWDERKIENEVSACSLRSITPFFLEYLPKDAPIVEAGCGLGAWVIFLKRLGYDIKGIDNDRNVIERLKEWDNNIPVQAGDVINMPYGDESIGAVISLGVLEHFIDGWDMPIREVWRVLRPGGKLFLTVPTNNLFRQIFANHARRAYLLQNKLRGGHNYFGEYRYTRREIDNKIRSYGFKPNIYTWDDFVPRNMSLGIWSEFPPFQIKGSYNMNVPGRSIAYILNSISPWIGTSGILCIAEKPKKQAH